MYILDVFYQDMFSKMCLSSYSGINRIIIPIAYNSCINSLQEYGILISLKAE